MSQYRVTTVFVALVVLVALLSYLGGYILLGDIEHFRGTKFRVFGPQWQAKLYEPAAKVESSLTGEPVATSYHLTHPPGWRPDAK